MKYHSYFVHLQHSQETFQSTIVLDQTPLTVHLTRVQDAENLYILQMKTQVSLTHLQKMELRRGLSLTVLLPVLAKYNKRKLKKMASLLTQQDLAPEQLWLELLDVENFLELAPLLPFFKTTRAQALKLLQQKEIDGTLRVLEIHPLYLTTARHLQELKQQMVTLIERAYEDRQGSIPLATLEGEVKIPRSSLLFRYLLRTLMEPLEFRTRGDKLVFLQVPTTEKDRHMAEALVKSVRQQKLHTFTILELARHTGLSVRDVNNTLWMMLSQEEVVQLNEQSFILQDDLTRIINRLKKFKRNSGDMIDIKTFRDLTTLTRQHIMVLFEYLDAQQMTLRVGNNRRILIPV